MCTYATVRTALEGSAKGPGSSWFHVTDGTVYFDHPVHAMAEHTLNIDFADPANGPGGARRGRAHGGLGARARRRDPGRPGIRTQRAHDLTLATVRPPVGRLGHRSRRGEGD